MHFPAPFQQVGQVDHGVDVAGFTVRPVPLLGLDRLIAPEQDLQIVLGCGVTSVGGPAAPLPGLGDLAPLLEQEGEAEAGYGVAGAGGETWEEIE